MEKPAEHKERSVALGSPARRYRIGFIVLLALLLAAAVVSLCIGRYWVDPEMVIPITLNQLATSFGDLLSCIPGVSADFSGSFDLSGVTGSALSAVGQVRLPRVIAAILVGAALSVAGAAYQGLFQNPMASQDIMGASSGAAFGAALGILLGFQSLQVSAFAFTFGLLAVMISYAISRASKMGSLIAMILAGMVVSSLCSAGTSFVKLVADTEEVLPAITYWLMGSFASVRLDDMWFVLPLIVAMVPIFLLRWRINLLATGEEEARSMGINADALRLVIIVCATFLTATCVSMSGLIGWVGLVIPHFCRILFGHDYRRIIPASMVMGSVFLLVVDDVARVLATSEIPIGILTAFVGAPVFVWLILREGGRHES